MELVHVTNNQIIAPYLQTRLKNIGICQIPIQITWEDKQVPETCCSCRMSFCMSSRTFLMQEISENLFRGPLDGRLPCHLCRLPYSYAYHQLRARVVPNVRRRLHIDGCDGNGLKGATLFGIYCNLSARLASSVSCAGRRHLGLDHGGERRRCGPAFTKYESPCHFFFLDSF